MDPILQYLDSQGITASSIAPRNSIADFDGGDGSVAWSPFARQLDQKVDLLDSQIAMSLSSMLAVHALQAEPHMHVLDTCTAPGIKGLYLNKLVSDLIYCAHDISSDRLTRTRRLFEQHNLHPSTLSKYDARFIDKLYEPEYFDRVLIDAPCSGEGVALGGDEKVRSAWSPAKVKRLQQLQIKIVKSAWRLLKPGGRLVYATCTLNKNENERVIRKSLGIDLAVHEAVLDLASSYNFKSGRAFRILPSDNSIGFFIAVLTKPHSQE